MFNSDCRWLPVGESQIKYKMAKALETPWTPAGPSQISAGFQSHGSEPETNKTFALSVYHFGSEVQTDKEERIRNSMSGMDGISNSHLDDVGRESGCRMRKGRL